MFHHDRKNKRKGGGVLSYYHWSLYPENVTSPLNDEESGQQLGCCVQHLLDFAVIAV